MRIFSCLLLTILAGTACEETPPPSGPSPGIDLPRPPIANSLPGPRPEVGPRSFVTYESGPVRPLALTADRAWLLACNTPDNHLEMFAVTDVGLEHRFSVPVGMEPVAVAVAGDGRAWVVNHLSDSVSVVDIALDPPRVVQTLWVGDEPRDIAFAGQARERAFVTTAHRGQNSPVDAALDTPGIGRADVWVFDADPLTSADAGGEPVTIVTLFGDTPRALATSPDGSRVYAAVFLSGNQTTVLGPSGIAKAPPTTSADGVRQPDTGVILRFDGQDWRDERDQVFNNAVPFSLPDYDIFEIDALAKPPAETRRFAHVGTTLFNMAINPLTGTLYVSNTDARNHVRFAGRGERSSTSVRGHIADQRVTLLDLESGVVSPRVLNKHLQLASQSGADGDTMSEDDRATSLSTPLGMAVSGDGQTLYVTAYGSAQVGVFATAALADDSFIPDRSDYIQLSAGGPSGIVLDEPRARGYVATRFDNGISIVDLDNRTEIDHVAMFNPEPASVVAGRPFLYDARRTSGNGNDSCATCHVFANFDGLAWDLGDPDGDVVGIPNSFIAISPPATPWRFHPMKGPMTTQSMRGLRGHGPMHWRGDRTGANRQDGETLEEAAFKEFNEAFDALLALGGELGEGEMQEFTDFAMEITYPPNPMRALDGSRTSEQAAGEVLFNEGVVRVQTGQLEVCQQCHPLRPELGLFGTAGLMANNSQPGDRNFKIPHFRDQYQKVGMFGWGFESAPERGEQVRGFGYNHNGATSGNYVLADLGTSAEDLAALRAFLFAFPTESPTIVGQQVTLRHDNLATASARIDILSARALVTDPVPECELIVHGVVAGEARAWLMESAEQFVGDSLREPAVGRIALEGIAGVPGQALTFTCAPWGSGRRMSIDRDGDGVLNRDEFAP